MRSATGPRASARRPFQAAKVDGQAGSGATSSIGSPRSLPPTISNPGRISGIARELVRLEAAVAPGQAVQVDERHAAASGLPQPAPVLEGVRSSHALHRTTL